MAARRLLLDAAHATHDPVVIPASSSSSSSPGRSTHGGEQQRQSFPTLLPVFILFVLLLCFLSIFLIRDLLHFFSLCLSRRHQRRGRGFHDAGDDSDSAARPVEAPAPPRKPAGLDLAVLASFPTVRFEAAASATAAPECAVCLSDFAGGEDVRLLTVCRHVFHTACIDSWLRGHTTCPVCRSDLDAPAPPTAVAVDVECDDRRGGTG